jgi:hypothetical protein
MGVSVWSGAIAVDGAGGGVTGEGNGASSEGTREDRGCPIPWLSMVHSVKWVRRRAGVGGWVVWERATELVQDWREFFGGVVAGRGGARATGGSRVVAASAPNTTIANVPEMASAARPAAGSRIVTGTVSTSTYGAEPVAAPATATATASEARPVADPQPNLSAPTARPTTMTEAPTEPAAEPATTPTTEPKVATIPEEAEQREGHPR